MNENTPYPSVVYGVFYIRRSVLNVSAAENMAHRLVLFDGESEVLGEVVVLRVVVDGGDLADNHIAALGAELVIDIGGESNAVAVRDLNGRAGGEGGGYAVEVERDVRLGVQSVALGLGLGVVNGDAENAAAAVDDVLGLGEMEVHGQGLAILHDDGLLAVGGADGPVVEVAVSQREQHRAGLVKVAARVVGDVPALSRADHVLGLVLALLPILGSPEGKLGKIET